MSGSEVWLVRHGETEWSRAKRHTGRTDIPLTSVGQEEARAIAPALAGHDFEKVYVSPLQRARQTCTARPARCTRRIGASGAIRRSAWR